MNYEQFVCALMKCTEKKLSESEIVERHEILKNNGVHEVGLAIRSEGEMIAPIIYADQYYQDYEAGEKLEILAERLIDRSRNAPAAPCWSYTDFFDFNKVKEQIVYKLVNAERNQKLLKEVPSLLVLDLAIIFYLRISVKESESCSVLIRNAHIDLWKTSIPVLYQYARKNTPRLCPCVFRSLTDFLEDLSGEKAEDCPMFVLTNETGINGASAILYPKMPKKVYETLGCNYYLLPATIHEFLIVPEGEDIRAEDLLCMVKEVNETQISEEDILSEHIYYFDGDNITKI